MHTKLYERCDAASHPVLVTAKESLISEVHPDVSNGECSVPLDTVLAEVQVCPCLQYDRCNTHYPEALSAFRSQKFVSLIYDILQIVSPGRARICATSSYG